VLLYYCSSFESCLSSVACQSIDLFRWATLHSLVVDMLSSAAAAAVVAAAAAAAAAAAPFDVCR